MDGWRKLTPGERDAFLARMEAKYADEEVSYIGTPAEVSQPDTPARVQGRTPEPDRLAALLAAMRPGWMADALCAEPAYADLPWFPERGQNPAPCVAVCRRCIVAEECKRYVVAHEINHGVWAGVTGRALSRLRRSDAA